MRRDPERFESGGARIYRIPLDLFPGLDGFAHLICDADRKVLVDVGSGLGESNHQLAEGLAAVRAVYGEPVGWDSLTHVIVSHGHIDHFGGLPFVRAATPARLGVHRRDRRVLADYERRLEQMADRLGVFLRSAGVSEEESETLMDMYLFTKNLYRSQPVDFTFDGPEFVLGALEILHVPGHCPGQIVIRINGIVLTSDHVLPAVTPHMAPSTLARGTGLEVYLRSLDRLAAWFDGPGPALGGHGEPMPDLAGRISAIKAHHRVRLEAVLQALDGPRTVVELTDELFPSARGYHRLLALEEVGAHVEFLRRHRRLDQVPRPARNGSVVRYRRKSGAASAAPIHPGRQVSRV